MLWFELAVCVAWLIFQAVMLIALVRKLRE